MFVGPVFQREVIIAPRRRADFHRPDRLRGRALVAHLHGLDGPLRHSKRPGHRRSGPVRGDFVSNSGPFAIGLGRFFSAMLAAAAVAHEKDRRTLILLLLTNLSNSELVLGKLLASILNVLVMLAAAFPLFMAATLLGGISLSQIAWTFAITLTSVLACGSLGSLLALWREKTFQALALTVLVLVLWVAGWEIVAAGALGDTIAGIPCPVLASRNEPVAGHTRSHPTLHPHAARPGRLGQFDQSVSAFLGDHRPFTQRHCHSHGPRLESIPRIGPGPARGICCAAKKHLRGR